MRRRDFIAHISALAAWPATASAQQPSTLHRIGYLSPLSPSTDLDRRTAFLEGLQALGYAEGKNVIPTWRFGEGQIDKLPELAADLVRLNVDVIVAAGGGLVAKAVKKASTTVPIVMTNAEDQVSSGLVNSLSRPGGNITGLTAVIPGLSVKRVQLLSEIVPDLSGVAVLWNPSLPEKIVEFGETETAAKVLRLKVKSLEVKSANDVAQLLGTAIDMGPRGALITLPDAVTNGAWQGIAHWAQSKRLASAFSQRPPVKLGGLFCYGPSYTDLFRRAATHVDKILKGANPSGLPVEQPTKFDLVINLTTARALGLTIPPTVLARADEVIE